MSGKEAFTPNIISAADLVALELPEPVWAVNGVISQGVNIVCGAPKLGKSWLMLGTGIAIASGGYAFGTIPVDPGEVLYLSLEDNRRKMQDRLNTVLGHEPAPSGLMIAHDWVRFNEGGTMALEAWCQEHPQARCIIIDTLAKLRPRRRANGNAYDEDYEALQEMKALANRHNLAVVVVHHDRKGDSADPLDSVSGTKGLSGAADTILLLRRGRGQADATLFITGRDVHEQELALRFEKSNATWTILGNAEDYQHSQQRQAILDCLNESHEPMKPADIADITGLKRGNVRRLLGKMLNDGQVVSVGYSLYAPVTPVTLHSNDTVTAVTPHTTN